MSTCFHHWDSFWKITKCWWVQEHGLLTLWWLVLPATGTWSSSFSSGSIDSVWTEQGRMWASGWVLCWRKERNETTDLVASQHEDELAEILLHVVELHLVFWCSHQGHSNRACGMKCNNHKLITIEYGWVQYVPTGIYHLKVNIIFLGWYTDIVPVR